MKIESLTAERKATPLKSFAATEITSLETLGIEEARMYSRMKYGDPIATRRIAMVIVAEILKRPETCKHINAGETLYVASSAYGAVPTASHSITREVIKLLNSADISAKRIKFVRKGDFATNHYGTLNAEDRVAKMSSRKISIRPKDEKKVADQFVVIVDDIVVTGSHEKKLHDVLLHTSAGDWAFVYAYRLGRDLASRNPETEEHLNRASVRSVLDLLPFFKTYPTSSGLKLNLNSRVLKFILSMEPEGAYDSDFQTKLFETKLFLDSLEDDILAKIYRAATSSDGYSRDDKFSHGIALLHEAIIGRDTLANLARKIQAKMILCPLEVRALIT